VKFETIYAVANGLGSLHKILLSSNYSNKDIGLSPEGKAFLQQTVEGPITVYRGITLRKDRVTSEQFKELKSLSLGNIVPKWASSNNKNSYTSASKSLAVASRYAKGGGIVMEARAEPEQILVDTTKLQQLAIDSDEFDEDDFNYMKSEKEVILLPGVTFYLKLTK
jgi:hypothetical protein